MPPTAWMDAPAKTSAHEPAEAEASREALAVWLRKVSKREVAHLWCAGGEQRRVGCMAEEGVEERGGAL